MINQLRALLGLEDSDGESSDESEAEDSPPAPTLDTEPAEDVGGGPAGDDVKALQSQVNDLETKGETHDNRIASIQNDMSNLQDDLEDVEGHIRDLLGIYDALSARVNPLVDGQFDRMPAVDGAGEATAPAGRFDLTENDPVEMGSDDESDDDGEDEPQRARTLDDLKEETGMNEPTPDPNPAPAQKSSDDHHHVASFAGTYAREVVSYQWLSDLLELAGVAGTLRALSYYHDIGWISADVKTALQRRLAGAEFGCDAREYRRLRADDHADSLAYVIMLEEMEQEQTTY